ncbi:MAG: hypothetical protein Q8P62_03070 [Candidatus Peregrinibacteria bacterium]|nr:hypothetical protein [Candidatus Peregrinibacteria bacterium]
MLRTIATVALASALNIGCSSDCDVPVIGTEAQEGILTSQSSTNGSICHVLDKKEDLCQGYQGVQLIVVSDKPVKTPWQVSDAGVNACIPRDGKSYSYGTSGAKDFSVCADLANGTKEATLKCTTDGVAFVKNLNGNGGNTGANMHYDGSDGEKDINCSVTAE